MQLTFDDNFTSVRVIFDRPETSGSGIKSYRELVKFH
jgi:hypothetical protein